MRSRLLAATLLSCLLLAGCRSALQPLHTSAVPEAGQAADDAPSLYASLRKRLREIKTEPSAERRDAMSSEAVGLGQRCDQVAPEDPLCDYGLALALGVQAKERPATAHDGLALMVERLQRAAARDPALDHAGPERVLGLLLVHAPGWPTGPGDPETGLAFARKAAARDPGYAPNWLAVAEAADALGDTDARKAAAQSARGLSEQAARAGEPDASAWQRDAEKLLAK
jgi:hypothetical protein